MKKFLIVAVLAIGLTSCYKNVKETVENPKLETTTYIKELPKDTVVVSIEGERMYTFDQNMDVKTITYGEERGSVAVNPSFILLLGIMLLLIGLIWGSNL